MMKMTLKMISFPRILPLLLIIIQLLQMPHLKLMLKVRLLLKSLQLLKIKKEKNLTN